MKKLLTERFQELAGIKNLNEKEDERFNQETKSVSGLAKQFSTISKMLSGGKYKGIDSGEINEIDDLINMILQAATEGNITSILTRVQGILGTNIKKPKQNA